MFEPIEALDAYNKNINILIGSGASADLFPTLVSMAIYFDPPLANKIDPPFIVYLVAFCFSR